MTTETQEAQETQAAVDNWSSVDRALGRLDGQNQVLMQNVQEQTRQSQENYRALDAKIAAQGHQSREDYRALDAKIDGVKSELEAKIDAQGRQAREDYRALDAKIDGVKSDIDAKIEAQNQVIREQGQQAREDYRAHPLVVGLVLPGGVRVCLVAALGYALFPLFLHQVLSDDHDVISSLYHGCEAGRHY